MVCIPGTPRYNCTVPISAPVLYIYIGYMALGEQGGAVPACIALRVPVVHASFTLNTTTPKGTVPYRTERTVLAHLRPPLERLHDVSPRVVHGSTGPVVVRLAGMAHELSSQVYTYTTDNPSADLT